MYCSIMAQALDSQLSLLTTTQAGENEDARRADSGGSTLHSGNANGDDDSFDGEVNDVVVVDDGDGADLDSILA